MSPRKLLLSTPIISSLFSISLSFAGSIEHGPTRNPLGGAYFGFGVGAIIPMDRIHSNQSFVSGATTDAANFTVHAGDVQFPGNVHLGCGYASKNGGYLAIEIFGEAYTHGTQFNISFMPPANAFLRSASISRSLNISGVYGILIRPGAQLNPRSLVYLIGGANFARIKIKNIYMLLFPAPANTMATFTSNLSRSQAGYRAGIGTAILMARHIVFRLEYVYSGYKRIFSAVTAVTGTPTITFGASDRHQVSSSTVVASIDFLFY